MAIVLYHCKGARSLRPVWTLEEMGVDYQLEVMPFPPRALQKGYLDINPLGTVPCMTDGDVFMTESTGICHYLVETYGPTPLRVDPSDPEYGAYLNWLYHSDATLTFPQTIFLRYSRLEPEERRIPQAAEDYRRWFLSRTRLVEAATADREFLCCGRFTIADIAVGYALKLATSLGIADGFRENTARYWEGLQKLPSYQKIAEV